MTPPRTWILPGSSALIATLWAPRWSKGGRRLMSQTHEPLQPLQFQGE